LPIIFHKQCKVLHNLYLIIKYARVSWFDSSVRMFYKKPIIISWINPQFRFLVNLVISIPYRSLCRSISSLCGPAQSKLLLVNTSYTTVS
jgi:hypothetical protein